MQVPGPHEFAAALPASWVRCIMQPPPCVDGKEHVHSERTTNGVLPSSFDDWLDSFWSQVRTPAVIANLSQVALANSNFMSFATLGMPHAPFISFQWMHLSCLVMPTYILHVPCTGC